MSNYTCPQMWEEEYAGVPFQQVPENCCRPIHVQPFTLDLHLFGFECNNQVGIFIGVIIVTCFIKILQNFLGNSIGQLERELMQLPKGERTVFKKREYGMCGRSKQWKCCGKLGYLIWLEIVAGVIGILSILVITGNNFWVWFCIILANSGGVYAAVKNAHPDHHSPASELLNVVLNAKKYMEDDNKSEECARAYEAIQALKLLLDGFSSVPITRESDQVRKRLIL